LQHVHNTIIQFVDIINCIFVTPFNCYYIQLGTIMCVLNIAFASSEDVLGR